MKTLNLKMSVSLIGIASLFLMLPMFVSCTGLDELRGRVDELEMRLDSLENDLNDQVALVNSLLEGGDITISSCTRNDNGTYSITLSNGAEITVMHDLASYNPLVSYITENGVKYWAMYNPDGVLEALVDGSGKKIPVSAAVPSVEERDGVYYLLIAGKEYVTGYTKDDKVSVITDYVVNTDESGNVYSVTFKIGEEEFTLSVDGYKGFTFMLGSAMTGGMVIKDLYVDFGSTYQITAGLDGVVDYVMQIPDGWRVDEDLDETTGELSLGITAPTKDLIASGAGVASGILKVVAVIDGGDAMVAKLELSTEPFKNFKVTSTNAVIEKYNGVDKFLYGLTRFTEYDETALFAGAAAMLEANAEGISESNINTLLSELLGEEVEAGVTYVLWAIPAFYQISDEDAGYYVKEGLIVKRVFGGSAVNFDVVNPTFNNATLVLAVDGIDAYYGGTSLKTESVLDDILYRVNNGLLEEYTSPMTYNGSAFSFPVEGANEGLEIVSESTYISWFVPVDPEISEYGLEDVIYEEFTLSGVTSGGAIEVKASDPELDCISISVSLTATDAMRIYYAFLTSKAAARHDETTRADYLIENGKVVEGESVRAFVDALEPEAKMTLFAMAIDQNGKYGDVLIEEYQTEELVYNTDLEVSLSVLSVGENDASVSLSVSGGTASEYVYWVGAETDQFWLDRGKSVSAVQQFLALYPDDADVRRAMSKYPIDAGVMSLNELKGEMVYNVVVLAKAADGTYSKAGTTKFTTLAVDLGTIVRADSETWKSAKEQIVINWRNFSSAANANLTAFYSFDITIPSNLTAYILCMTEEYFENNPDIQTLEDKIIEIETKCSRKYDSGRVVRDSNGNMVAEPDWVDDNGDTQSGTLLNVYDFYVHGFPKNGFATYFASGTHGESNCTSWQDGNCTNYAYALEHITKRHSVDYYLEYVKNTRGSYCQKKEVLEKAAQDLFDAYYPYYKDAKPLIYVNEGEPLYMENHYAIGVDDEGNVMDDVFVVLVDADGNYYEPMSFEVPNNFN